MTDAPAPDLETFPRLAAATMRFTRGAPRAVRVTAGGSRLLFLRSAGPTDPVQSLWSLDLPDGPERQLVNPVDLLGGGPEQLSATERAHRERVREAGAGITAFACDDSGTTVAFALSGRLFVLDVAAGSTHELDVPGPVADPRPSPDGTLVAYLAHRGLHVVSVDGGSGRSLALPASPTQTVGAADFISAEELDRHRGYWWSPDSAHILAATVDEEPVQVWWVGDPTQPATPPQEHRYPRAGTPNADVGLVLLAVADGRATGVRWDPQAYPYLAAVHWSSHGPALAQVLTRGQETAVVLSIQPTADGVALAELVTQTDPSWVDVVPGLPAWAPDGRLLTAAVVDDDRALCADGVRLSPAGVSVLGVEVGDGVVSVVGQEAGGQTHLYSLDESGWTRRSTEPGVHTGVVAGGVCVLTSATMDSVLTRSQVFVDGAPGPVLTSLAATPPVLPAPVLLRVGARGIPTALLLPPEPHFGPLPVLMAPYGGPHGRMVVATLRGYLQEQWWAEQGFAVIVADGRGTPGPASWERAVDGDLLTCVLADQVDALRGVDAMRPGLLDLDRVAIHGWSFGGFLAAAAVLDRPDVFHAAVAGAPVTDQAMYDTAYSERYLGLPADNPDGYARSRLVERAAQLTRPLMLVHGLADDNVFVAHSLRMSAALLAAGRAHQLLLLSGATHMPTDPATVENLLLAQRDFLMDALRMDRRS